MGNQSPQLIVGAQMERIRWAAWCYRVISALPLDNYTCMDIAFTFSGMTDPSLLSSFSVVVHAQELLIP